jgi:hypothetical protein
LSLAKHNTPTTSTPLAPPSHPTHTPLHKHKPRTQTLRYGYLLFNGATTGENVRFTYNERASGATCGEEVKVWSFVGDAAPNGAAPAANAMPKRTMRVVVINKVRGVGFCLEGVLLCVGSSLEAWFVKTTL